MLQTAQTATHGKEVLPEELGVLLAKDEDGLAGERREVVAGVRVQFRVEGRQGSYNTEGCQRQLLHQCSCWPPTHLSRRPPAHHDSQGLGVDPNDELELALSRAALGNVRDDVGVERAQHLVRERAQGLEVAVCQLRENEGCGCGKCVSSTRGWRTVYTATRNDTMHGYEPSC